MWVTMNWNEGPETLSHIENQDADSWRENVGIKHTLFEVQTGRGTHWGFVKVPDNNGYGCLGAVFVTAGGEVICQRESSYNWLYVLSVCLWLD